MKQVLIAAMFLLAKFSIALAEPASGADIPVRYTSWDIAYDVNIDGSYVETQKWSAVILKENELENNKTLSITFSKSIERGEIIEAYTIKKSGKRIDAPIKSQIIMATARTLPCIPTTQPLQ